MKITFLDFERSELVACKSKAEAVALALADDLQLNDQDIASMKGGNLPYGWSNTLLDRLAHDYNIEDEIIKILIGGK